MAFGALILAPVLGLVPTSQIFAGFGHPAVVIIALVLSVSCGLSRSGAINLLARRVLGPPRSLSGHIGIMACLVAMLVAIGVLRASGALDLFLDGVRWAVGGLGIDTRWVDGVPTALMRPLSRSGARGMMLETMETMGADSFAGRLVSTIEGR